MSRRRAIGIGLLLLIASGCAVGNSIAGHLTLFPLSFADGLIWLFKADWGLPFLWFALPLSLALSSLLAHQPLRNPMGATAFGTRSNIFRHHMSAACAMGAAFGIAAWAIAIALSLLDARDGLVNLTDPSSLYALTIGVPAAREPDLVALAATTLVFSVSLSCLYSTIMQAALLLLRNSLPAVMALPLLGIPTINRPLEGLFDLIGCNYSSLPGSPSSWRGILIILLAFSLLILCSKRAFEQRNLLSGSAR